MSRLLSLLSHLIPSHPMITLYLSRVICGLLLLAPLLVSRPLPAQARAADRMAGGSLQPGDQVRITVWRGPELSGEFTITGDGTITHPLYRSVSVAGVPMAVAEERILEVLRTYQQNPQVVLEPLFRVTVGGEVLTPNLYSLLPETTIAQAVALAGGPSERGRLDRVRILRGDEVLDADLTSPDGRWARTPIRSGDQILVGRRGSFFRDVIGPLASVAAAIASVVTLATR